MIVEQVAKFSPEERFLYWMRERHNVYLRRLAGEEKPWTDDIILQSYFFTNPYRENDKVTIWVKKHIRRRYARHPNLWFMLCVARQLNRPETLQMLMDKKLWPIGTWRAQKVGEALDAYKTKGNPIYTGAYMIRAESDPKKKWYSWSKQQYISQIVLGRVWKAGRSRFKKAAESLESTCRYFQQFHGWGGFMSYEVVSDLRHTRYLQDAPDILTWANPGPGAKRGLNRLQGKPVKTVIKEENAVKWMRGLLELCWGELPVSFPKFEMREVEHSLCEFDKYERMRLGEGRSKRKYQGV